MDHQRESTFLVFLQKEGNWTKLTERSWNRGGHSCLALNDEKLLIIGGEDGYEKSVDILDLASLTWSKVKYFQGPLNSANTVPCTLGS